MKGLTSGIILGLSFLSAVSANAGGVKEDTFTLSPLVGGYSFDGLQHLETMPMGGIRAGYNFTKYFGAELGFEGGRTEGTRVKNEATVYRYGADLLFHLLPDSKIVPYLAAGYGGITFDTGSSSTKGIFDYGPGVKVFLTDRMALRGDFRHLVFDSGDDTQYNYQYLVGLSYQFGAPAPAPAPVAKVEPPPAPKPVEVAKPLAAPAAPVLDSDGDGVPDPADKCPGTPSGVKVDQNGCPLDTDGDGVYDYLDKCPGTPAGVKVDQNGCPLDTDGDGVYDYLDKCPGTPVGVKVDQNGCPLDTDGDGVYDYLDKCPGTPAGVKVDKDGCPPDTDGDGVADYLDQCPDTSKGAKVDKDGCSEARKLSINLEIEFDTGKSDIKPQYHDELKKVGDFMTNYPEAGGVIEGHTDNVGSAQANKKLSQKRADAVRQYIISTFGVAKERLTAKGYGEEKPVTDNATAAGRQKNRRIVATVDTVVKPVRKK